MNKHIEWAGLALATVAMLALQACGTSTVSKDISQEGVAKEIVFPDIKDSAWLAEGTFPNLDNLRNIAPGVTKDQLYDLIGRPHFREGMAGVREWDYIFHFRTPTGIKTCQYKAIFDKDLRAQTFHWLPKGCGDVLAAPAPAPLVVERVIEKPPVPVRRFELSADALFAFDRSGTDDLLPKGRKELDALAAALRDAKDVGVLEVTGHTDRLGGEAYNQRLSLARAATVRRYLVDGGVRAQRVEVNGRGETQPKVQCNDNTDREALIACLAPNRRVEISVQANK